MSPVTTKIWTIEGSSGFEDLKYHDGAPVPRLGERDVLVRFHYASLNYCDLLMPKVRLARQYSQHDDGNLLKSLITGQVYGR